MVRHAYARRRVAALDTERCNAAARDRVQLLPAPRCVLEHGRERAARADARHRARRRRRGRDFVVGARLSRGRAPGGGGSSRACARPRRRHPPGAVSAADREDGAGGPALPRGPRRTRRLRLRGRADSGGGLGRGPALAARRSRLRAHAARRLGEARALRRRLHVRRSSRIFKRVCTRRARRTSRARRRCHRDSTRAGRRATRLSSRGETARRTTFAGASQRARAQTSSRSPVTTSGTRGRRSSRRASLHPGAACTSPTTAHSAGTGARRSMHTSTAPRTGRAGFASGARARGSPS